MTAPAPRVPLLLLLAALLAAPAAAQTRTLVDDKDPDVTGFQTQTAGPPFGALLQGLGAVCDGTVTIESTGNLVTGLHFDQKRLEIEDDSGTPGISIEIAETGYSGTLVEAPGKCRLETRTRTTRSKAKARLDCRLGANGTALDPPPTNEDIAAVFDACKDQKRVKVDKNLSRIKITLRGTFVQ